MGDHIRQSVIGAVCPQDGALFSLVVDGVDTDVFQFYLNEMAAAIPKRENRRQLLVLDNASWHKAARLNWHHFEPVYLPAYSPDFNPIERLWLVLKAEWFWDFSARTPQEQSDRALSRPQELPRGSTQNHFGLRFPETLIGNRSKYIELTVEHCSNIIATSTTGVGMLAV